MTTHREKFTGSLRARLDSETLDILEDALSFYLHGHSDFVCGFCCDGPEKDPEPVAKLLERITGMRQSLDG